MSKFNNPAFEQVNKILTESGLSYLVQMVDGTDPKDPQCVLLLEGKGAVLFPAYLAITSKLSDEFGFDSEVEFVELVLSQFKKFCNDPEYLLAKAKDKKLNKKEEQC